MSRRFLALAAVGFLGLSVFAPAGVASAGSSYKWRSVNNLVRARGIWSELPEENAYRFTGAWSGAGGQIHFNHGNPNESPGMQTHGLFWIKMPKRCKALEVRVSAVPGGNPGSYMSGKTGAVAVDPAAGRNGDVQAVVYIPGYKNKVLASGTVNPATPLTMQVKRVAGKNVKVKFTEADFDYNTTVDIRTDWWAYCR